MRKTSGRRGFIVLLLAALGLSFSTGFVVAEVACD